MSLSLQHVKLSLLSLFFQSHFNHYSYGLKLLTRLRVGLRHYDINSHNIEYIIKPICSCIINSIESAFPPALSYLHNLT